jgi:hypothetical protein
LAQDKGHRGEWRALKNLVDSGNPFPIRFEDLIASTLAVFAIRESVKTGAPVDVSATAFLSSPVLNVPKDADFDGENR